MVQPWWWGLGSLPVLIGRSGRKLQKQGGQRSCVRGLEEVVGCRAASVPVGTDTLQVFFKLFQMKVPTCSKGKFLDVISEGSSRS